MRIVIDLQAAQTGSRFRGIGHYSIDLLKAMIAEGAAHEFYIVLNGMFRNTIEPIRAEFEALLPQDRIRVWYAPGPVENFMSERGSLRESAQIIREFYLRSLEPDVVLITSVFEGLGDDAIISVKNYVRDLPTAAIFYDLTPLILPDEHFAKVALHRHWYRDRIEQLRKCDLLLAISQSSKDEAVERLQFPADQIVDILGGINPSYRRQEIDNSTKLKVLGRYGITKPFLMYAGGVEKNKNLRRLVEGLSLLPTQQKRDHELVIVGKRYPGQLEEIQAMAPDIETLRMLNVVDFVPKADLIALYNLTELFVFPSLREGLGLPPAEAMACGAPTIVANATSLPEVVDNPEALFDPMSGRAIARKINDVLTDKSLRDRLVTKGLARAAELTWVASARAALGALERRFPERRNFDPGRRAVLTRTSQFAPKDLRIIAMKLDHNGDFLLSIPAMAKLRARYPNARIDALVGSWNRSAAEQSKLFNHVYTLDYYKGQSAARPHLDEEAFDRLLAEMPFYDFAIDMRRQHDTRFILIKLQASKYFGYRSHNDEIDRLLTDPLDVHPDDRGRRSYFDETHTSAQMLRIVDALPFDIRDYVQLPDLGERQPVKEGSVAIFPRVGLDARQWDSARFGALIDNLARSSRVTQINLYAGKPEELAIIKFAPSEKIMIRTGLDFSGLFSSLSANAVCVGNNSFGVHLAGYAGCRTIGIYSGHEIPEQWGPPFGDSVAITIDAACAPCHLPDRESCPFDMFCLSDISVENVKDAVLDAIVGEPLPDSYSRINMANPASVLKPLTDAINKSKFLGKIDGLSADHRTALGAALAIDFPARGSPERHLYLDLSGMLETSLEAQSNRRVQEVQSIIQFLRDSASGKLICIASSRGDHEFYAVEPDNIEESLFGGSRSDRTIIPMAGDVYIGLHTYLNRTEAQWNLLSTWRQMGVRTIFTAPEMMDFDDPARATDDARALQSYLFTIGQFDGVLTSEKNCRPIRAWLDEFGPPRLREIACDHSLLRLVGSDLSWKNSVAPPIALQPSTTGVSPVANDERGSGRIKLKRTDR